MIIERQVAFESEGVVLRGLLLQGAGPERPQGRGLVIMAHGTSATIQMVAIDYARAFALRGLSVLLYDHRNFGSSDGEPRGEINPWVQCRGYLSALSYVQTLPGVDLRRVGLWGDSYTGGQVAVVAACDPRPCCVVAQCPVFGVSAPHERPTPELLEIIRDTLLNGDVRGGPECTTGPLPVVSFDQHAIPSLLQPIQAFRWFIDYGGRAGSGWVNRVTRVIPPTPVMYSPSLCAPFVWQPALMMVAPGDEMVHANPQVARQAFDLLPGPKEWHEIADGHFGLLYPESERFKEASSIQAEFLCRHLLEETPTKASR